MNGPSAADAKRADLAATAGALGVGVGLGMAIGVQPGWLATLAIVVGGVVHGWGMLNRHRLEAQAGLRLPTWSRILYWTCWIAMAGVGVIIALKSLE